MDSCGEVFWFLCQFPLQHVEYLSHSSQQKSAFLPKKIHKIQHFKAYNLVDTFIKKPSIKVLVIMLIIKIKVLMFQWLCKTSVWLKPPQKIQFICFFLFYSTFSNFSKNYWKIKIILYLLSYWNNKFKLFVYHWIHAIQLFS